ncbi:MAG: ATP-binding protein [Muribaculaceae bacterium]|nr:ATP-binding protein [Muribaculaceae bacterium]
MNYQIDYTYTFRVLPSSAGDEYFHLAALRPDGSEAEIKLSKLQFQRSPGYVLPAQLNCRVKSISPDGLPVVTHIVAPYVYELYENSFARGDTFEAEVVSVPSNPAEEPFMLRDTNGIFYPHFEPEGLLSKGQIVRCKFSQLTPRNFRLARVDEGAKLPYYSLADIMAGSEVSPAAAAFVTRLVEESDDMSTVRAEIRQKSPLWPLSAARTVIAHLPEWFLQAGVHRRHRAVAALLKAFRRALLYLLEGSGYLNAVPAEHRRALRQQLTEMVESIDPYTDTLAVIAKGRQDVFVESILDKLQRSGYLYHPAQQFGVLMLIFRLHPDKVGNYLNRIFESIFSRDLENWKREPFRSAFVEQFKIYVSQSRAELDALPLAETREQKSRLETIITAIALQLILADDDDPDRDRTESLFFRYVALLRPLNNEALLSKSFLSLMGADLNTRLSYRQLKEPMMMMTQATVMPAGDYMARLTSSHRYSNGSVDITVSEAGIQLSLTRRRDITERVIPDGLMGWLRPQIFLNGIRGLSGPRLRKLADHNQWWHDIESSLFDAVSTEADTRALDEPVQRRHADKGDDVYIVIDGIDDYFDNNPTFNCHIADSDFEDGSGILKRDQIVGYNLKQPSATAFTAPDGSQLGFLARVLDIRPDGSYIFSLRDEVDSYIEDAFNFDDEYIAIVAGINERDYSAITRAGVGLFIEKDPEEAFTIGDIVHIRLSQKGKQGQIRAYITERSDRPEDKFDKAEAFANLLRSIGESDAPAEEPAEELIRDFDEMLRPDDVRELIGILRFKAIAESDLIKAYDYLRFGRILSLVIGDKLLADKLGTHASLLTLHQYYATNSRIDADKLEALQAEACSDPLLKMIYHRLAMVSWLGKSERNAELYANATEPANELEGSIARMVLSYNMLNVSESAADTTIASEIKQEIMKKLNVNNETRRSKYYGSESKYLEFKTSIVYPATAPGEEMREDPEAQQFHIMSRVAGLLNADGGRLYIGVNNDGYEVGMHDDFKYFARRNASIGRYSFKIKNLDNLCVFIENLVNETFGASVGRKIAVSVDDEAEKGVILLDIKESLDPVFIDGRLFVRQSGQSTREYHGQAIDDFVRERAELRAERMHLLSISQPEAAEADDEPVAAQAETDKPAESTAQPAEELAAPEPGSSLISTSRWRPNVLHSYETGYAEPFGYLYFNGEKSLIFSRKDLYMEPGFDGCRLALAIPHELADGFLILAYDNERALRIPLAEIYEKGENTTIEYNSEHSIMFAAIAAKDDALVCVGADSADTLWRRANKVALIEQAHLMSSPRRLHDAPIHHTVAYEIADAKAVDRFADCLSDKIAGKRFGATMRVKESSPNLANKLELLVNDCH